MEFAVLEMIHKLSAQHDAIYGAAISDLQKKMEILPSALSRLLRGMEEKGLCVRSIDPKDRRSSYVSLTETGQTLQPVIEAMKNWGTQYKAAHAA